MQVILYQPGAYGDLVTSIIDSTDFSLTPYRIIPNANRTTYVGKTTFAELDTLYIEYSKKYIAISNHLFSYNINRGHDFILIDSLADSDFEHCHARVTRLVPEYHNESLEIRRQKLLPLINKAKERTDKIIQLRDILDGNLISVLRQWISTPLNEDIYAQFLSTKFT